MLGYALASAVGFLTGVLAASVYVLRRKGPIVEETLKRVRREMNL